MAAINKTRCRNIQIKTGVVKRLAKEEKYYEQEAERERGRLDQMKEDSSKDEHDCKKQEEIISESLTMIADCKRKLAVAYQELEKLIDTEKDLEEAEQYVAAVKMLEQTKEQVKGSD